MGITWWFVAIEILLWAQQLLAQGCPPSFDWARNNKGQDPCTVAALLQGGCRNNTNVTIATLAPNEIYVGPDPQNTNDICACNTVVYSLLSVCAACQDRFYIDWLSWTKHCALSYLQFPGNVTNATAVPGWALLRLSPSCNRFDMDAAMKAAIDGIEVPVSTSTTMITTTSASSSTFTATTSNPPPTILPEPASTSSSGTTGSHNKPILIGAIVGSVVATVSVILGACCFIFRARKWARARRSSAGSKVTYSLLPILGVSGSSMEKEGLPSTPGVVFRIPAEDMNVTRPSEISHSQYPSRISIPTYMQSQSPDSGPYSPAQASSDIFTTVGGHSESHSAGHTSGPNSRRPSLLSKLIPLRGNTLPSSLQTAPVPEERTRGSLWAKDDSTLDIRRY